jgi:hypothetical protein
VERKQLTFLFQNILHWATRKANLRMLTWEEVKGVLIDEQVFKIVQEAAQLQAFRNVRNLGK